jgi:hypothetical protein
MKLSAVALRRYGGIAITGLLAATTSCAPPALADPLTRDRIVREMIGARDGIVMLANPGTCAFTPVLSAELSAMAAVSGRPVVVRFFGIHNDSATLESVRSDLNLTVPASIISRNAAEHDVWVPEGGPPTLLVVRAGKVVVVAYGGPALSPYRWATPLIASAIP